MATKYCCKVERNNEDESVALFNDTIPTSAMYAFADACVDDETIFNAKIIDLDTGEVLYDVQDENSYAEAEREGMYDETGYNPYMGCYDFDC